MFNLFKYWQTIQISLHYNDLFQSANAKAVLIAASIINKARLNKNCWENFNGNFRGVDHENVKLSKKVLDQISKNLE